MKKYTFTNNKDTRSGFGAGMAELGKTNPNVVALCADLLASLKLDAFIKDNPKRSTNTQHTDKKRNKCIVAKNPPNCRFDTVNILAKAD